MTKKEYRALQVAKKQKSTYKKPIMELYNDNFQNFKRYNIPKAQVIIADIPYNLGINAYASSRAWWNNGNYLQGESKKAKSNFFKSDLNFNIAEFFHFASKMLKKEPKGKNEAGAFIVFCAFEQMNLVQEYAKKYGFKKAIPIFFRKKNSAQTLKANMRILNCLEYGFVFYREKLPKFRNNGKMVLNCFDFDTSIKLPKVHPTQKPYNLIKRLIMLFSDENDVVIDPVCGSGVSLLAGADCNRHCYGFEIEKEFVKASKEKILSLYEPTLF